MLWKIRKPNIKNIEILTRGKLNSMEFIILKAMQDSNIYEKGYLLIKDEVSRCRKLKKIIEKRLRLD